MSISFPSGIGKIIKASIKLRASIDMYTCTAGKRWQCLGFRESDISLSCILNNIGSKNLSSVKIQKQTTRVQVLSSHIGMTDNVPFVLVRT